MSIYKILNVSYIGYRHISLKMLFKMRQKILCFLQTSNSNSESDLMQNCLKFKCKHSSKMHFTTLTSANAIISNPQTKINYSGAPTRKHMQSNLQESRIQNPGTGSRVRFNGGRKNASSVVLLLMRFNAT